MLNGGTLSRKIDSAAEKLREKEFSVQTDIIGAGLFLILAVILIVMMPSQVVVSETDVVNGRVFPSLVLWLIVICCVMLIVAAVMKRSRKEEIPAITVNLLTEVKAGIIMLILLGTYLISKWTDLFVAGAIFCAVGFLLYFRCNKKLYYVITVTMAVLIWVAFRFGLGVRF